MKTLIILLLITFYHSYLSACENLNIQGSYICSAGHFLDKYDPNPQWFIDSKVFKADEKKVNGTKVSYQLASKNPKVNLGPYEIAIDKIWTDVNKNTQNSQRSYCQKNDHVFIYEHLQEDLYNQSKNLFQVVIKYDYAPGLLGQKYLLIRLKEQTKKENQLTNQKITEFRCLNTLDIR